jgi:hypothetical protein
LKPDSRRRAHAIPVDNPNIFSRLFLFKKPAGLFHTVESGFQPASLSRHGAGGSFLMIASMIGKGELND